MTTMANFHAPPKSKSRNLIQWFGPQMNTRLSKTILDPKFEERGVQRLAKHMMSNSTLVMETQISWLIWEGSHLSEIFLHFRLKILGASVLLSWFFHKYSWLDNKHWLKISRIRVLCSIIMYTLHQVNLNQFKVIIFPLPSNTYQVPQTHIRDVTDLITWN